MTTYPYYIVDVFAEKKYAGNQLAVFRNAEDLSTDQMQQFAKEMNYSETTFIESEEQHQGGYNVRIFTPEAEIPFAGHPTLGTAFVLQKKIIKRPVDAVLLNLKLGQIRVSINYKNNDIDTLYMKQISPIFEKVFEPAEVAPVLKLSANEIDQRFPIQEVSTGLPFLIVPLKKLKSIQQTSIDLPKFKSLVKNEQAKAVLMFCPETYSKENQLNVRVFADLYGVPEDPATGSANGCLAGYLLKYNYFKSDKIDIRVEQGHEIGRPSLLYLHAEEKAAGIDIFVGGKAVLTATGDFV